MSKVILVDDKDVPLGEMEKMAAHTEGRLHRAFSVLLFNSQGQMLLQKRAIEKYHSGGLWSNACCSHPLPGEPTELAAKRRLWEELGIKVQDLQHIGSVTYFLELDNDLFEHELDHVYTATFDGAFSPNEAEVEGLRFIRLDALGQEMCGSEKFTKWFHLIMGKFYNFKIC